MKLFQARIPDAKNESPNSLLLDSLLAMFGTICSLGFHALWKLKLIGAHFVYLNIPIVIIAVMMFLFIVFRRKTNRPPLRFFDSSVSFLMGWMFAISIIDFLV